MTQESSIVVTLRDLRRLEDERVADERRAADDAARAEAAEQVARELAVRIAQIGADLEREREQHATERARLAVALAEAQARRSTVPGTVDLTPMSTVPGTVDRTRWPVIVPLIAAIAVAVWAEIRVRDERRRTDAAVETLAEQLEALSRTPDKEVYGAGHRRPDPVSTVPGTVDVTPTEPPAAPAAKPVRPATRPAKPDPRRREVPIDPRCAREPLGCLKGR